MSLRSFIAVCFVSRRRPSDLGYGRAFYGATPPGTAGTAGSSDDCYVSDASEDLVYGEDPGPQPAPRREPVVDGFTNADADLMYAQLASSLYGEAMATPGYGYCAFPPSYDCSRFQLTNYGHLKIDYSCSWRSLDHYIAHS